MNNAYIFSGVLLLLWTYWNYRVQEVDLFFFHSWLDFDIHKSSSPFLYRVILVIQALTGIGMIVYGVFL